MTHHRLVIFRVIRPLGWASLFWAFANCGQNPSFNEKTVQRTDGSGNAVAEQGTPQGGVDSGTPAPNGGGTGGDAGGSTSGSTAGAPPAGAGATGGGTGGDTGGDTGGTTAGATAGGTTAGATAGGTTAGATGGQTASNNQPPEGSAPAPAPATPAAPPPPGLTPAQVAELPGVAAVKVGVNFEDLGLYGDKDFNDAVLCFTGNFKVNGASVVSTATQQVIGHITSISGCHHDVLIRVTNPDGSHQPDITVDDANIPPQILMAFEPGSKLDVVMTSYTPLCVNDNGQHPDLAGPHDMADAVYAHVLPNVCNTTGN